MSRIREDWQVERKLLNRWAIWTARSDSSEVMRLCGVTWAGSPLALMGDLWSRGAIKPDDVAGYAPELPAAPDYISPSVDEFMTALAAISPAVHDALLARHARIVRGERIYVRSESWVAQALYGLRRSGAWKRLAADCVIGYGSLRRWREIPTSKSGNTLLGSCAR